MSPRPVMLLLAVLSVVYPGITDLLAHGSIILPISRVAHCRFGDSPENPSGAACAAAVFESGGPQFLYDWNGVRQGDADGQHQLFVPDGTLCSGNQPGFEGLDLPRSDWTTTTVTADASGRLDFVYQATAPHETQDMLFYITPQGWDPTEPLRWSDLDLVDDPLKPDVIDPFCHIQDVFLEDYPGISDQVYRMSCSLPNRVGRHLIYHVWQRSDSPEAFYACIDVEIEGILAVFRDGFESGTSGVWSFVAE